MNKLDAELIFIEEHIGKYSLKTIADILERHPKTIAMTLIRKRGTSNTKNSTGMLTAGELAKILKVDRNTVVGWIDRHGLPYIRRITRYKKRFTFIEPTSFWKWAEQNKGKLDFSKIEKNTLIPEPNWVDVERENKKELRPYKGWTLNEEQQLIEMVKNGYSFMKIAEIMERTTYGVDKKYKRLLENSSKYPN